MPAYAAMTNASFFTSFTLKKHHAFALGGLVAAGAVIAKHLPGNVLIGVQKNAILTLLGIAWRFLL